MSRFATTADKIKISVLQPLDLGRTIRIGAAISRQRTGSTGLYFRVLVHPDFGTTLPAISLAAALRGLNARNLDPGQHRWRAC